MLKIILSIEGYISLEMNVFEELVRCGLWLFGWFLVVFVLFFVFVMLFLELEEGLDN